MRMEESASAVENACMGDAVDIFSGVGLGFGEAEQKTTVLGSFVANGELSFGRNIGFERFVGIVRDMVFLPLFLFRVCEEEQRGRRRT